MTSITDRPFDYR